MAKRSAQRKKDSHRSMSARPSKPKRINWTLLLSNTIWAIIGVVLGVAGTELYRPDLEIKEGRVSFKLIDDKVVNGERVMLYETAISIRNSGLKKGYIDRAVIRPFGVESFSNAEVSFVNRMDIGAKRTGIRTIQVRIRRPQPDFEPVSGFAIEVFDDTETFAFNIFALIDTGNAISRVAEDERRRRFEIQRAQQKPN